MYSNHKAPRKVSRRVVLGTAGAGALGAAAVTAGVMKYVEQDSTEADAAAITAEEAGSATTMYTGTEENPLVAYLPDPQADTVKVFYGTDVIDVKAPELVALMKRAAKI